jgi:hypothetical protein
VQLTTQASYSAPAPRNGAGPGHRDDRQQRNQAQVSSLVAPGGSTHDRVPQTGRAAADLEAGDAITIGRARPSCLRACARPPKGEGALQAARNQHQLGSAVPDGT